MNPPIATSEEGNFSIKERENIEKFGQLLGKTFRCLGVSSPVTASAIYLLTTGGLLAGCSFLLKSESRSWEPCRNGTLSIGVPVFNSSNELVSYASGKVGNTTSAMLLCPDGGDFRYDVCYPAAVLIPGVPFLFTVMLTCGWVSSCFSKGKGGQALRGCFWDLPNVAGEFLGQKTAETYYKTKHLLEDFGNKIFAPWSRAEDKESLV